MKKIIIGVVAIVVIIGAFMYFGTSDDVQVPQTAEKELRIGYIVYSPLLMKDPQTGALSGISYDIVEATAKELGYKTNWVEEVGWGTALEGLNTNRYDILGTQMWPNEAREKVAVFTKAPMNSDLYPYVKKGDTRFSADSLGAINSSAYKVGAIDGSIEMFIAQEDYSKAQLLALPQTASFAELFLSITQGKADVTFTESASADDFNAAQEIDIERLGNTPVRTFGNSFAVKKDNIKLLTEWNGAITKVIAGGDIEKILEKYSVSTHYSVNH